MSVSWSTYEFLYTFTYLCICVYIYIYIGLVDRVFTNGPGDWSSISGRVIPKTQKMVLNAPLLNIQHYKVQIKSKMGKEHHHPLHFGVVDNEKGAFRSPSTTVSQLQLHVVKLEIKSD